MTRKPRSLASEILRRLANSLSVLAAKPFVKPDPPASSPPPSRMTDGICARSDAIRRDLEKSSGTVKAAARSQRPDR